MACAPVRRDNLRALARGLSTVQADILCSILLVPYFACYGVFRAKDWVPEDCGTILFIIFIVFCLCFCSKSLKLITLVTFTILN